MSGYPWYRNGALVLVAGVPAIAVLLGLVMLVVAGSGPTDLVRSDWYKHGRAVNEDLSRVHAAHALGLVGTLEHTGSLLTVHLQGPVDPDVLQLTLIHPTLADGDRHLVLSRVGGGRWQTRLEKPLAPGPRAVQLTAPGATWRLEGRGQLLHASIRLTGLAP